MNNTKPTKPVKKAGSKTPPAHSSSTSRDKRFRGMHKSTETKVGVAYEYWKKNPYMLMVDIFTKFKTSPESLRAYIKKYNLPRPDGKDYSKKSSRQEWIAKGYKHAVKKGLNARQAALWVEEESDHHCGRGDIQYWAMKNDLPYLPEASNMTNKQVGNQPPLSQ